VTAPVAALPDPVKNHVTVPVLVFVEELATLNPVGLHVPPLVSMLHVALVAMLLCPVRLTPEGLLAAPLVIVKVIGRADGETAPTETVAVNVAVPPATCVVKLAVLSVSEAVIAGTVTCETGVKLSTEQAGQSILETGGPPMLTN
jgi:hypothetical protein